MDKITKGRIEFESNSKTKEEVHKEKLNLAIRKNIAYTQAFIYHLNFPQHFLPPDLDEAAKAWIELNNLIQD